MGLKTYQKKRDFRHTPEPKGRTTKSKRGRTFVIQKHAATRLHYDFRLELDGVLKSWAVPKGPSPDPGTKRLAVHVEDHPVEYGTFEGTIPEGEYGGGTVMLWDRGTWRPDGDDAAKAIDKGKLKFTVKGKRMQGAWMLVRMTGERSDDGKNWLLIKEKDDHAQPGEPDALVDEYDTSVKSGKTMDEIGGGKARKKSTAKTKTKRNRGNSTAAKTLSARKSKAPRPAGSVSAKEIPGAKKKSMPSSFRPELATLVDEAPGTDEWLHEIKFDGYRILAFVDENGRVRLRTRNDNDWTKKFRPIADAINGKNLPPCILDGEVVVLAKDGRMNFQALQNVVKHNASENLVYYTFDLPYCDGYDLTAARLVDRKKSLHQLMGDPDDADRARYCDHVRGGGEEFYGHACRMSLEGIMCKRADSRYHQRRTRDWVKVKCVKRQEFVIGGYTAPGGSRKHFGALLLGYHDDGTLRYCGKVGTGFDTRTLADVHAALRKLERKEPPFADPPTGAEARGVTWVAPTQVAEIEFIEWTDDNRLRHPSFHGLRTDKPAEEIVRERPQMAETPTRNSKKSASGAQRRRKQREDVDSVAGERLTHPDRVLYPEQGITKRALAEYYEAIQDWALPHMVDRPLSIVRCPEGRTKECFYQKHKTDGLPDSIDSVRIKEKSTTREYIVIRNLRGLIGCVQIGALEIHPWGCKTDKIENPDRMVFDLDPDPGTAWDDVKSATSDLRAILESAGLECFLKTSGGKGLHIVVPLMRRNTWDEVKSFSQAIAQGMAKRAPKKYVATMSKAKRKGKIFVDYLRNARGQTSVAPYSTRAREGATVSVPLRWDELNALESARGFNIENTTNRLARLKKDPWEGIDSTRQSISRSVMEALDIRL